MNSGSGSSKKPAVTSPPGPHGAARRRRREARGGGALGPLSPSFPLPGRSLAAADPTWPRPAASGGPGSLRAARNSLWREGAGDRQTGGWPGAVSDCAREPARACARPPSSPPSRRRHRCARRPPACPPAPPPRGAPARAAEDDGGQPATARTEAPARRGPRSRGPGRRRSRAGWCRSRTGWRSRSAGSGTCDHVRHGGGRLPASSDPRHDRPSGGGARAGPGAVR